MIRKLCTAFFVSVAVFGSMFNASAQTKIKDNTILGTSILPNINAIIELESSNKGLLLPRVALTATNQPAPLSAFISGMTVYNTDSAGTAPYNVSPGAYVCDGTQWVRYPWSIPKVRSTNSVSNPSNGDIIFDSSALTFQYYDTTNHYWQSIAVPAMDSLHRNTIAIPLIGQTIFNTDEQCLNTYNGTTWVSLCGTRYAQFTITDCSNITLNGVYTEGVATNGGNYLSITVNVTQAGDYSIQGTTTNGYGFSTQGAFVATGTQTVLVPAQGTPINENPSPAGDLLTLTFNGTSTACTTFTIPVSPAAATYSINCGSAQAVGTFAKGNVFTGTGSSKYLTVGVTVTSATSSAGNYTISTNTVAGISFQGSGSWSAPGIYTVQLQPTGTFTSNKPVTFNLIINSADGATSTCTATITPMIPQLTFLSVGNGNYVPGTDANNTRPMTGTGGNGSNFGPNGIVKYNSATGIFWATADHNNFSSLLNSSNPPDIVYIGYSGSDMLASDAFALVTYIQRGGIVFFNVPLSYIGTAPNIIGGQWTQILSLFYGGIYSGPSAYMGEGSTTPAGVNNIYPIIAPATDPIINGPFGNLAGASWSEDNDGSVFIVPPPGAIVYSNAYSGYGSAHGSPIPGFVSMFRDGTYNFMYGCDGGWLLGTSPPGSQYTLGGWPGWSSGSPNYTPGSRQIYNGGGSPAGLASNYILFCNWLAWAMQQAVTTGINASNY